MQVEPEEEDFLPEEEEQVEEHSQPSHLVQGEE